MDDLDFTLLWRNKGKERGALDGNQLESRIINHAHLSTSGQPQVISLSIPWVLLYQSKLSSSTEGKIWFQGLILWVIQIHNPKERSFGTIASPVCLQLREHHCGLQTGRKLSMWGLAHHSPGGSHLLGLLGLSDNGLQWSAWTAILPISLLHR